MEKIYNKLVRDKIPEIIKNNNEEAIIKILPDDEYKSELVRKLYEEYLEVTEARDSDNFLEELSDMLEVINSLAKIQNKSLVDLTKIMLDKRQKRGSFDDKIFLLKVTSK